MKEILSQYIPIADMLVATFGNICEVTLHDLTTPKASVVYVAGNVTGRKVGQSFDHLVKQVLLSKDFQGDHKSNYFFTASNEKAIKSSTAFIRDNGKVVGAICINLDVSTGQAFFKEMSQFFSLGEVQETTEETEVGEDVASILDNLIENILSEMDLTEMNRKKAVEIVKFMDEKGIFLVKGAVEKVAAKLGVSKVTIYSYLDVVKGKRQ